MSPKRRSRSTSSAAPRWPLVLGILTAIAVGLFAAGELLVWTRSDAGRLALARHVGIGDPRDITRLVSRRVRAGLEAAGIPSDSVRESVVPAAGGPRLQWRIGLAPDASLLKVNHAVTRSLEAAGGEVLSGVERALAGGGSRVLLTVGLPGRPTHDLALVRAALPTDDTTRPPARVAIVLFGLADGDSTRKAVAAKGPWAVAVPAGRHDTGALIRAAREAGHEIVLQLPMEPVNYPRVDPGPGTLLVGMKPARITGEVDRWLDQAGDVVAVSNLMGSFATQDEPFVTALYEELRRKQVTFLHVHPAPRSVCKALAARLGVAYEEPDWVIDRDARAGRKGLEKAWRLALDDARERGHAIVMLRDGDDTRSWLASALADKRAERFTFVPPSALLRRAGPS